MNSFNQPQRDIDEIFEKLSDPEEKERKRIKQNRDDRLDHEDEGL